MEINHEGLVRLVVWYASNRGIKLTTLRLVKFLYLADLYHARVSEGKTLTGWPWAFVYFGPFCQEAKEAIEIAARDGHIQFKEYPSKFDDEMDYRLFWMDDTDKEPDLHNSLSLATSSKLQWAIQKWADDSFGLLDYVYFETEPMIKVKRGAVLDFTIARIPEVHKEVEMRKISKVRVLKAKRAVERLREKYKSAITSRPPQGPVDRIFREAINKLEEDDLETGLEGIADLVDLDRDRKT